MQSPVHYLAIRSSKSRVAVRRIVTTLLAAGVALGFMISSRPLAAQDLHDRIEKMVIPKVDFNEAKVEDVIVWMRQTSERLDPEKTGINIVVDLDDEAKAKTVTMKLRKVPLDDFVRFFCHMADLEYRITGKVLIITSEELPAGKMETRTYPVKPGALDVSDKKDAQEHAEW